MERGYVKLWRKTLDSGIISNGPAWQLFGYLLLNATYKQCRKIVNGVLFELKPGDVFFSRRETAQTLKLGEQQIRTALKLLETSQIITLCPTRKGTIISFVNWDRYNSQQPTDNPQANPQTNPRLTHTQPTDPLASSLNNKNVRIKNLNTYSASADAVHSPAASEPAYQQPPDERKAAQPVQQEQGEFYRTRKKRILKGKRLETFNRFWRDYDFPRGKAEAADAWLDIPELTDSLVDRICAAARQEAQARSALEAKGGSPKWAQGWLSGRRWEDYDPQPSRASPAQSQALPQRLSDEEYDKAQQMRKKLEAERKMKKLLGTQFGAA